MCCAASYEFRLIDFVLLQMVHIFASQTNHFPPIKALFELVTSVTLTIFQQGRRAGNSQLQRAKEIMWFWYLFCHCFLLFACICFFKPARTETDFRNGHDLMKWFLFSEMVWWLLILLICLKCSLREFHTRLDIGCFHTRDSDLDPNAFGPVHTWY